MFRAAHSYTSQTASQWLGDILTRLLLSQSTTCSRETHMRIGTICWCGLGLTNALMFFRHLLRAVRVWVAIDLDHSRPREFLQ